MAQLYARRWRASRVIFHICIDEGYLTRACKTSWLIFVMAFVVFLRVLGLPPSQSSPWASALGPIPQFSACRCHPTTVCGLTIRSDLAQCDQNWRSRIQNSRSERCNRGRFVRHFKNQDERSHCWDVRTGWHFGDIQARSSPDSSFDRNRFAFFPNFTSDLILSANKKGTLRANQLSSWPHQPAVSSRNGNPCRNSSRITVRSLRRSNTSRRLRII